MCGWKKDGAADMVMIATNDWRINRILDACGLRRVGGVPRFVRHMKKQNVDICRVPLTTLTVKIAWYPLALSCWASRNGEMKRWR
jgi:hypothetical protein